MIRKIVQFISNFPLVSARTEEQFYEDMEAFVVHGANTTVNEQNQLRTEINNTVDDINAAVEDITAKSAAATQASTVAQSAANYKGDWNSNYNSGQGYSLAHSVTFTDGFNYVSKINNNTTSPVSKTNTAQWNWIESINPDDYTSAKLLVKIKEVDGTGSGLDADLFRGLQSTEFMRKSVDNTVTQNIIFNNGSIDSPGLGFASNNNNDLNIDMYNGNLRFFRNNGLSPFSVGTDNNLYSDNGTNGNGRLLTNTTPIGYASGLGVGGTVTQGTWKTDTVTLNKLTGAVYTSNSALAAGASVSFTLNNNLIGANDIVYLIPYYAYIDPYNYRIELNSSWTGGCRIKITNISTGSLSDIVTFKFIVIKGAIS